jgi:hypothetical protein
MLYVQRNCIRDEYKKLERVPDSNGTIDTNPYPHTLLTYNLQNIPDSDNQKTVTTKEQQIWTTKQAYPQLEQLV